MTKDTTALDWSRIPERDMVAVRSFAFEPEAQFAKAILDAEGIPNFLKDAMTIGVYSGLSAGLGGIQLMVLAQDAQRAVAILDRDEADAIPISDEMLDESVFADLEMAAYEEEQAAQGDASVYRQRTIVWLKALVVLLVAFMAILWLLAQWA